MFRQLDSGRTPLNGVYRIIDGVTSQYTIAEIKNGMLNGVYKFFKNQNLREEGYYKEGRKEGVYKEFYSDGISVREEREFKDGKLNGASRVFYTNEDVKSEKFYRMGVEDGTELFYDYDEGDLVSMKNYKDGRLHGKQEYKNYSNIGDFKIYATYNEGKCVGEYLEIFTDGSVRKYGNYNSNGRKDGEKFVRDNFSSRGDGKFGGRRIVYDNGDVVEEEDIKDFEKFVKKN